MRFTIWQRGKIVGTFEGETEQEALDNFSKHEGYVDFEDSNVKQGFTRDDYSVKRVV